MESAGDKFKSFLYALLVHLGCVLVMLLGMTWTQAAKPVSVAGAVIEASLVAMPASYKPPKQSAEQRKRAETEQREKKQLEQKRREMEAAELQRQDQIEREKVAALALEQAEAAKREQEERHRQEQVDLTKKVEEQKQDNKEDERLQQLADIRKQREEAAEERKKEQLQLAKLQEQRRLQDSEKQRAVERERMQELLEAEQKQGNQGDDDSLLARYTLAIQLAVRDRWNRPETAQPGLLCSIRIIQIPGGEVIQAIVAQPCNADEVVRTSIEQAVMRAAPLPYEGYEKVFARDITFNFRYDG